MGRRPCKVTFIYLRHENQFIMGSNGRLRITGNLTDRKIYEALRIHNQCYGINFPHMIATSYTFDDRIAEPIHPVPQELIPYYPPTNSPQNGNPPSLADAGKQTRGTTLPKPFPFDAEQK